MHFKTHLGNALHLIENGSSLPSLSCDESYARLRYVFSTKCKEGPVLEEEDKENLRQVHSSSGDVTYIVSQS